MDDKRKDNLTDVASQISNQSQQPQSTFNNQPQNLADNQVIGNDGTVIDLGNNSQNIIKK